MHKLLFFIDYIVLGCKQNKNQISININFMTVKRPITDTAHKHISQTNREK